MNSHGWNLRYENGTKLEPQMTGPDHSMLDETVKLDVEKAFGRH